MGFLIVGITHPGSGPSLIKRHPGLVVHEESARAGAYASATPLTLARARGYDRSGKEWRNQNQAVFADISITILNFASFSSPIGSIGYTAIQNEEGVRPTSQPCRLADVAIAPDCGRSAFALPALRRSKAMGFACERAVVGFATIRPIRGAGFLTYDFAFAFFAAICCSAQRAFFRTSGSWSSAMTARNASPSG
jgi:hypothetical protein